MSHPEAAQNPDLERLAERVRAASYGTVLVIAALGVANLVDIDLGYSAELVFGVGVATWIAHLYSELLGRHVTAGGPLHRGETLETVVDGLPILAATVVPALMLVVGQVDAISDGTAWLLAMTAAFVQLALVGVVVARRAPGRAQAGWAFTAATVAGGLLVGVAVIVLGH